MGGGAFYRLKIRSQSLSEPELGASLSPDLLGFSRTPGSRALVKLSSLRADLVEANRVLGLLQNAHFPSSLQDALRAFSQNFTLRTQKAPGSKSVEPLKLKF